MAPVWAWRLVALCALARGGLTFSFSERRSQCDGDAEKCVSVLQCPAYRTRQALLSSRPKTCGFSGDLPLVCCSAATETEASNQLLPGPGSALPEAPVPGPAPPQEPTDQIDFLHDSTYGLTVPYPQEQVPSPIIPQESTPQQAFPWLPTSEPAVPQTPAPGSAFSEVPITEAAVNTPSHPPTTTAVHPETPANGEGHSQISAPTTEAPQTPALQLRPVSQSEFVLPLPFQPTSSPEGAESTPLDQLTLLPAREPTEPVLATMEPASAPLQFIQTTLEPPSAPTEPAPAPSTLTQAPLELESEPFSLSPIEAIPSAIPPAPTEPPPLERCGDPYRVLRSARRWSGRVFGSVGARVGRWPWMVLFGRWSEAGLDGWFCGGALISDQHVLTAAHCLRPEEAASVGARIGDHDLLTPVEVRHQERNLSAVVRHPRFFGAQNDLAVVRLSSPVELTEAVWPACLPPADAEVLGHPLWVAGWGASQPAGHHAMELLDTALQLTDMAHCETTYQRTPLFDVRFPGGFQGTKLCASRLGGMPLDSTACPADAGGPLMAPSDDDRYQVVGVWSIGLESCGTTEFPGIYTRVASYTDWILSNLT